MSQLTKTTGELQDAAGFYDAARSLIANIGLRGPRDDAAWATWSWLAADCRGLDDPEERAAALLVLAAMGAALGPGGRFEARSIIRAALNAMEEIQR